MSENVSVHTLGIHKNIKRPGPTRKTKKRRFLISPLSYKGSDLLIM